MAGGIIAIACFVYLARQKIDSILYKMTLPDIAMGDLLMNEMLLTMGVAFVFVLILFIITAGRVFKRIDGPLIKMAGVMGRIGKGYLHEEVKLRENDEFQNLAKELDETVNNLRSKFSAIRTHAGRIEELGGGDEDIKDSEQFLQHFGALKKEIDSFKV